MSVIFYYVGGDAKEASARTLRAGARGCHYQLAKMNSSSLITPTLTVPLITRGTGDTIKFWLAGSHRAKVFLPGAFKSNILSVGTLFLGIWKSKVLPFAVLLLSNENLSAAL